MFLVLVIISPLRYTDTHYCYNEKYLADVSNRRLLILQAFQYVCIHVCVDMQKMVNVSNFSQVGLVGIREN